MGCHKQTIIIIIIIIIHATVLVLADMHLWHEDLDDTEQTETEWRQDRGSVYEAK